MIKKIHMLSKLYLFNATTWFYIAIYLKNKCLSTKFSRSNIKIDENN